MFKNTLPQLLLMLALFSSVTAHSQPLPQQAKQIQIKEYLSQADLVKDRSIDSALFFYDKATRLAVEINDRQLEAEALLALGVFQIVYELPRDQVTLNLLRSMNIFRELRDSVGISSCLIQLGVLSFDLQNYQNAIQYLQESLNHGLHKSRSGIAHYLMAISYSDQGDYDKARGLFKKALDFYQNRDLSMELQVHAFTGKMLVNQGLYEAARDTLLNTLLHFGTLIDSTSLGPTLAFLASAYLGLNDSKNAIRVAESAHRVMRNESGAGLYMQEISRVLHQAYRNIGRPDKAYMHLLDLYSYEDSLYNKDITRKVAEISGRHEFQKEMERKQLEQQLKDAEARKEMRRQRNFLYYVSSGLALALLFSGLILYQRNRINRERKRSDELLLNILPKDTAEELKRTGTSEARNLNQVTVLFADFEGFTFLSEQLSPAAIVQNLNDYFSVFDAIMEKYEIEKIKTIGDSYMAAGGLNDGRPDSVERTLRAALEMSDFAENRIRSADPDSPKMRMRIGLHTGPVVAGIVGIKKFQYDIWGDTVNTASRMESSGTTGKVNISQQTYDLVSDHTAFRFESRGLIQAKGKGAIEMYFVHWANA